MRAAALMLALGALPAEAYELRTGWQLGLSQSMQGMAADGQIALDPAGTSTAAGFAVAQTGLLFTTAASANLTIDLVTTRWDHGLLLGVAATQTVPTLAPAGNTLLGPQTGLTLNASYLARRASPRWGLELGLRYGFGLNAQLQAGANGGTGGAGGTQAGQQAGRFQIATQTHTLGASAQLDLTRRRWDARAVMRYDLAINGVNTVANAVAPDVGTPLSAFVPATTHTLGPSAQYRHRLGRRGTLVADLGARWTLPVVATVEDGFVQNLVPETLATDASLAYERLVYREHRGFSALSATLGTRVPTSIGGTGRVLGTPIVDPSTGAPLGLRPDALIYRLELGVEGRFESLALRYRLAAGAAHALLYQPPLGLATPDFASYDAPVVGVPQPIVSLALDRRFDPVDLNLLLVRAVALGGLGSSAVITHGASLAATTIFELSNDRALRVNAGLSATRLQSAGDELPAPPSGTAAGAGLAALTIGSAALAALAGAELPVLRSDGLSLDASASYTLAYNDPTVDQQPGAAPGLREVLSHTFFLGVRGAWGRGPLEGRDADDERLAAYVANPRDGQPLVSARLANLRGATPVRALAPGLAAETRSRAQPLRDKEPKSVSEASSVRGAERVGAVEDKPAPARRAAPTLQPMFEGFELLVPIGEAAAAPGPPAPAPEKTSPKAPSKPPPSEPEEDEVDVEIETP